MQTGLADTPSSARRPETSFVDTSLYTPAPVAGFYSVDFQSKRAGNSGPTEEERNLATKSQCKELLFPGRSQRTHLPGHPHSEMLVTMQLGLRSKSTPEWAPAGQQELGCFASPKLITAADNVQTYNIRGAQPWPENMAAPPHLHAKPVSATNGSGMHVPPSSEGGQTRCFFGEGTLRQPLPEQPAGTSRAA